MGAAPAPGILPSTGNNTGLRVRECAHTSGRAGLGGSLSLNKHRPVLMGTIGAGLCSNHSSQLAFRSWPKAQQRKSGSDGFLGCSSNGKYLLEGRFV